MTLAISELWVVHSRSSGYGDFDTGLPDYVFTDRAEAQRSADENNTSMRASPLYVRALHSEYSVICLDDRLSDLRDAARDEAAASPDRPFGR